MSVYACATINMSMAKINMKETDYYKSGKHTENYLNAVALSHIKQAENKQKRIDKYNLSPTTCNQCISALPYNKRKDKFCDRSCAAKFNNRTRIESGYSLSTATKLRIGQSVSNTFANLSEEQKEKYRVNRLITQKRSGRTKHPDVEFCCPICASKITIPFVNRHRKTCGEPDCRVQASVGERNYINGRRKPSWFYNPNEDKEVLLDSSWEVEIAQFLVDNNVKWIRPKFVKWVDAEGKTRRYFPDFYLVDYRVYLDPKNPYGIITGKDKIDRVSKLIELIVGDKDYIKEYITSLL
jgi:hypothetical protein